ncbi:MAG: hypothetical protein ACRDNC_13770, partial [Gaiellaceae bacterium]
RGDSPLVDPWQEPTSLSAAVAGPFNRLRPTRSYTTLWDVTPRWIGTARFRIYQSTKSDQTPGGWAPTM